MAFKVVKPLKETRTIYLGDDTAKQQVPEFVGWPFACKHVETNKRGRAEQYDFIYCAVKDAQDAEVVAVKAPGKLNHQLTFNGEIRKTYRGKCCRFTYAGRERVKGYPQPLVVITVEVDEENALAVFDPSAFQV
jgi:hypothetical protein